MLTQEQINQLQPGDKLRVIYLPIRYFRGDRLNGSIVTFTKVEKMVIETGKPAVDMIYFEEVLDTCNCSTCQYLELA